MAVADDTAGSILQQIAASAAPWLKSYEAQAAASLESLWPEALSTVLTYLLE